METTQGSRDASWREEPVNDVPANDIDVMEDPDGNTDLRSRSLQYARHMVDYTLRGIKREHYNRELVLMKVISLLTEELKQDYGRAA